MQDSPDYKITSLFQFLQIFYLLFLEIILNYLMTEVPITGIQFISTPIKEDLKFVKIFKSDILLAQAKLSEEGGWRQGCLHAYIDHEFNCGFPPPLYHLSKHDLSSNSCSDLRDDIPK